MAAQYPTSAAGDNDLYIGVNNKSTTLTDNPLAAGAVTVNVLDASAFPSNGAITIDAEIIRYTGKTATSFTGCTRGFDGTSDVSHTVNTPVYHHVIADHHNVLKDEIKAIEADLIAVQAALNQGDTPASTASDVKDRFDQVVSQLKLITGETNWYDAPDTTITLLNTLKSEVESCESALNDADTPASTATDIKDRLDQIVSEIKRITGNANWYDTVTNDLTELLPLSGGTMSGSIAMGTNKLTGLGAGSTNGDSVRYEQVVFNTGDQSISGVKDFTGQLKGKGTSTNDSAASGYIGEYIQSVITSNTNYPATGVYGDLTSISLTAGDWDVSALIQTNQTGATITALEVGISTTSGNSGSGLVNGSNNILNYGINVSVHSAVVPVYRMSLSATTTVYLKYIAAYSVATPTAIGRLSARRVR